MNLMTKRDVAKRLAITTRTIDRLRAAGYDLGVLKLPGGAVRFDPQKIEEIIRVRQLRRQRGSVLPQKMMEK
jgi:predicted site-specific integrase-resolvase